MISLFLRLLVCLTVTKGSLAAGFMNVHTSLMTARPWAVQGELVEDDLE